MTISLCLKYRKESASTDQKYHDFREQIEYLRLYSQIHICVWDIGVLRYDKTDVAIISKQHQFYLIVVNMHVFKRICGPVFAIY